MYVEGTTHTAGLKLCGTCHTFLRSSSSFCLKFDACKCLGTEQENRVCRTTRRCFWNSCFFQFAYCRWLVEVEFDFELGGENDCWLVRN